MPWAQFVCHSFPSSACEITPALRFNAVVQRSLEGRRPRANTRIHQPYNQHIRLPFPCRILFLSPSAKVPSKLMTGGADAPLRAEVIAGTSLSAWVAVLICRRLITFYRPPFFH